MNMLAAYPWGLHLARHAEQGPCWRYHQGVRARESKARRSACLSNAEVALGSVAIVDIGEGARGDIDDCHAAASLHRVIEHSQQPARQPAKP